jgi:hypothetical protein
MEPYELVEQFEVILKRTFSSRDLLLLKAVNIVIELGDIARSCVLMA